MAKTVAIFDVDHTLIEGDSFWPYLTAAVGMRTAYSALARAVGHASLQHLRVITQGEDSFEPRDFLKDYLIRQLLTGKRLGQLDHALARLQRWRKINPPIVKALRDHQAKGDVIVIATGGLSLYMPQLLEDLAYDALICTDIGVDNGVVTGTMINGNCVREIKAARVAAWLAANGPFAASWAYGNYPHDVPMMAHAQHRIIVS